MSLKTLRIIPPKDRSERDKQFRLDEIERMKDTSKSAGPCWLCGYKCSIRKWAAHVEKHRKEGWFPRDRMPAKRPAIEVFAEWQQADATPDDYGSLAEYRQLTGQK